MPQSIFAKVAEYGNLVAATYGNGCTLRERSRICALPELGLSYKSLSLQNGRGHIYTKNCRHVRKRHWTAFKLTEKGLVIVHVVSTLLFFIMGIE